ncbi:Hsp20/alpha crystallin family protein [Patescibacteria group bacterium]
MPKKEKTKPTITQQDEARVDWLNENFDGQLAIDVYQSGDNIVIKSAIAGVQPDDIDITVNNDMVTIRGVRHQDDDIEARDFYFQECYWGGFSRSVVLPVEVDSDKVAASIKNGVLTVTLPKAKSGSVKNVEVEDLDETE